MKTRCLILLACATIALMPRAKGLSAPPPVPPAAEAEAGAGGDGASSAAGEATPAEEPGENLEQDTKGSLISFG